MRNSKYNFFKKLYQYKVLFIISLLCIIFDQISKSLISKFLSFGGFDRITLINDFIYFINIGNEGAAWGMFSEYKIFLTIFSFVVLISIYYLRALLELKDIIIQIPFGLLTGGIVGNLIDRIRLGYVIDFIDIKLPFDIPIILSNGRWPTFNIADMCILFGLLYYLLISSKYNNNRI